MLKKKGQELRESFEKSPKNKMGNNAKPNYRTEEQNILKAFIEEAADQLLGDNIPKRDVE